MQLVVGELGYGFVGPALVGPEGGQCALDQGLGHVLRARLIGGHRLPRSEVSRRFNPFRRRTEDTEPDRRFHKPGRRYGLSPSPPMSRTPRFVRPSTGLPTSMTNRLSFATASAKSGTPFG